MVCISLASCGGGGDSVNSSQPKQPKPPPETIVNFSLTSTAYSSISLIFKVNKKYKYFYRFDDGDMQPLPKNLTIIDLTEDTIYNLKLKACNMGCSDWSDEKSVRTLKMQESVISEEIKEDIEEIVPLSIKISITFDPNPFLYTYGENPVTRSILTKPPDYNEQCPDGTAISGEDLCKYTHLEFVEIRFIEIAYNQLTSNQIRLTALIALYSAFKNSFLLTGTERDTAVRTYDHTMIFIERTDAESDTLARNIINTITTNSKTGFSIEEGL